MSKDRAQITSTLVSNLAKKAGDKGLSAQELIILLYLFSNSGDITQSQLAGLTDMTPGAISKIITRLGSGRIDPLTKKHIPGLGWIDQNEDPVNRRAKLITLSRVGRLIMAEAATGAS